MARSNRACRWCVLIAAAVLAMLMTVPAFAADGNSASSYTISKIEGSADAIWHQEETIECLPGDLDSVKNSFDKSIDIDKEGFKGTIPLAGVSAKEAYGSAEYETNQQVVYTGLPNNDVSNIAQTAGFTVESGNYVTLSLAGITWSVDGVDEFGLPTSYSANCLYRGVDTMTFVDHYEVTAVWEGKVEGPAVVSAPVAAKNDSAKDVEDETDAPLGAVVGGSVAAAAIVAVTIVFFYRRSRFRITEEKDGKESTLTKVKVEKDSQGIAVKIPGALLASPIPHYGYPPSKYVKQQTNLVLYRSGTEDGKEAIFYDGPALDRIRLKI